MVVRHLRIIFIVDIRPIHKIYIMLSYVYALLLGAVTDPWTMYMHMALIIVRDGFISA